MFLLPPFFQRQALLSGHPAAAAELAALAQRLHGADAAALSTAVSIYPLLNIAPKVAEKWKGFQQNIDRMIITWS